MNMLFRFMLLVFLFLTSQSGIAAMNIFTEYQYDVNHIFLGEKIYSYDTSSNPRCCYQTPPSTNFQERYFFALVSKLNATKGAGDLTKVELKQLQKVVNEAGRPVEVVGSAAKSTRRNVGSNLPVGKGPGTKSDIDILIPSSSKGNFNGLSNQFPKGSDINVGTANPNIGPSIRIEPNL